MDLSNWFPGLTAAQQDAFAGLEPLYRDWNSKINVISRKDMESFETHHVLHSLAIAKLISFKPGTTIIDAGTGGGFPGIPLAILFPEAQFTLVDSIGKKIKVVQDVAAQLGLTNVTAIQARFEELPGPADFVTGRAVSALPLFVTMVRRCIRPEGFNDLPNGILYLTGGEIASDIAAIRAQSVTRNISDFFPDPYFETKKVVHLSAIR